MPFESKRNMGLDIDARRDWRVLCGGFCLLILAVLIADIYLSRYGFEGFHTDVNTKDLVMLDRSKLTGVVNDWKAKEIRFEQILKEKPAIVDPSL